MNSKNLGILALIAAAVLALAFWVARDRAPATTTAASPKASGPAAPNAAPASGVGAKLSEVLGARPGDVAEIAVHASGKDAVVKREGAGWAVVSRSGYPADPERVRDAVLSIGELTISEAKTQKPENYAFLGVQDPDAKDSPARQVTFKDAQGGVLASVIVGNSTPGTGAGRSAAGVSVYVRRAGEAQAFEARGRLDPRASIDVDPVGWIKKDLDGVAGDRVKSVTVTHADASSLAIAKNAREDREYALANMPAGRELKYAGATGSIATALSSIAFDDVRPVAEIAQDATPTGSAEFRTFDGLVLSVDTSTKDGVSWATFAARYEAPAPAAAPTPPADPAAAPAAPVAAGKSEAEVKKEVDTLNAKVGGWAFALPSGRIAQIFVKVDDLLKPVEAPGDKNHPAPAGDEEMPPGAPDK